MSESILILANLVPEIRSNQWKSLLGDELPALNHAHLWVGLPGVERHRPVVLTESPQAPLGKVIHGDAGGAVLNLGMPQGIQLCEDLLSEVEQSETPIFFHESDLNTARKWLGSGLAVPRLRLFTTEPIRAATGSAQVWGKNWDAIIQFLRLDVHPASLGSLAHEFNQYIANFQMEKNLSSGAGWVEVVQRIREELRSVGKRERDYLRGFSNAAFDLAEEVDRRFAAGSTPSEKIRQVSLVLMRARLLSEGLRSIFEGKRIDDATIDELMEDWNESMERYGGLKI